MTQDLAAALLKDVPRYRFVKLSRSVLFQHDDGDWLPRDAVLDALSRAPDPALFAELVKAAKGLADNSCASCDDHYVIRATKAEWEAHCAATERVLAVLAKIGGGA